MRKLILILWVVFALPCVSICQTYKIAEVTRIWNPKHINISDGLLFKYKLYDGYDTAYRYIVPNVADTFDVEVKFTKRAIVVLPDLVSSMDDNVISTSQTYSPATNLGDNVWSPTTAWAHMKNQPWNQNPDGTPIHFNKTVSILETAGWVELSCTCYKVEWYSEVRSNHGIVTITIDGGAATNVDLYKATPDTNNSTKVWTSPASITTNANRKFRVTYTGTKNPAATSANFAHDRFVIYTKQ